MQPGETQAYSLYYCLGVIWAERSVSEGWVQVLRVQILTKQCYRHRTRRPIA